MNIINIGKRREVFWDDFLVEKEETTAILKQHGLIEKEPVFVADKPWEGSGTDFHCFVREDKNFIRMYYCAVNLCDLDGTFNYSGVSIAYAESHDNGKTFIRPELDSCEYKGYKKNNIILYYEGSKYDGISVFKDENPNCKKGEKYKLITRDGTKYTKEHKFPLKLFVSEDGIHFNEKYTIMKDDYFDSQNIVFWDKNKKEYVLFYRTVDDSDGGFFRGIKTTTSKDFLTWSEPKDLIYQDDNKIELYTNVVSPYVRAPHMYIGFPSRYIERAKKWTDNYDYLPNVTNRKNRTKQQSRYGLVLTDCVLMTSRDGVNFNRWQEAFIRPGIENDFNWVYGDAYPTWSNEMLIMPSDSKDNAPDEINIYMHAYHWQKPTELRRYVIRLDGFISYNATYKPCKILTKPFIFKGEQLTINFSTSAIGYIRIKILDENKDYIEGYESYEIFGDSVDRKITFGNKKISKLAGKPIRMLIEMSDADLYSFKF